MSDAAAAALAATNPLTAPVDAAPTAAPAAAAPAAAPAAPPAAAPVVDAPLAFKLPEDVAASADVLAKYGAAFKEAGVTDSAKAQRIVDTYVEQVRAQVKADRAASDAAWTKEQADLQTAAKADPEIGGANWNASVQAGQKALLKIGNPKFNALLDSSGLGNHPEVIRAFAKLGKLLGEDSVGGAGSGTGGVEQTAAQALKQRYPSMTALIKA